MIPETRRSGGFDQGTPEEQPTAGRIRDALGELFPLPARTSARPWGSRTLSAVAQTAAVGVAAVLMLLRVPGIPSWDTIYGEDYWQFLTQAIQQPWHLFIAYDGYYQLLPRLIAQFATLLPLARASEAFAVAGALVAACCGLFIFHASAGHVRSAGLRALLAAALVLLPAAPMEIIDSGVDSIWYLLPALFWAVLWRPRTRTGMAVAAVVGFVAAASNIMSVPFVVLLAVRVYVLRSPREHAVTAGWLAGTLMQVPFVISGSQADSRLGGHATAGQSLAFYGHQVLLPSLGWHFSWWLRSFSGLNGATLIAAAVLVIVLGAILVTQALARVFVVAALLTGFFVAVVGITVNGHLVTEPQLLARQPGSRYTDLPIFLIEAAVIVGADCALRCRDTGSTSGHRRPATGLKPTMTATALVAVLAAVLAATWATDFRYAGFRSEAGWTWAPIAAKWKHDCAVSRSGEIAERIGAIVQTLPCDHIRSEAAGSRPGSGRPAVGISR